MTNNNTIKLSTKIKRWWFELWYGEKFEYGFTYRKIYSHRVPICNYESAFNQFEKILKYWEGEGWEKHSDIQSTFTRLYVWIKKKRSN